MKNKVLNHLSLLPTKKIFYYICVLDAFFIPYFSFINITYTSLFIILRTLFTKRMNLKDANILIYYFLFLSVSMSTLIGFILYPNQFRPLASEAFIFISSLSYYMYFRELHMKYKFDINNILVIFILFVVSFGFIYITNSNLYEILRSFFFPKSTGISPESYFDIYSTTRFYFIYQDPNNVCYIVLVVISYLILNKKQTPKSIFLLLCAQLFITIITYSIGGALATSIFVGIYLFSIRNKFLKRKEFIISVFIFIFVLVVFIILIPKYNIENEILSNFIVRLRGKTSVGGDSRIGIWLNLIQEKSLIYYIFLGNGGVTFLKGVPYSTHNGILYLIYSYGMVSCIAFMYLFFRRRNKPVLNHLWFIPLFIGFVLNILIGEQKIGMILGLILAEFDLSNLNLLKGN